MQPESPLHSRILGTRANGDSYENCHARCNLHFGVTLCRLDVTLELLRIISNVNFARNNALHLHSLSAKCSAHYALSRFFRFVSYVLQLLLFLPPRVSLRMRDVWLVNMFLNFERIDSAKIRGRFRARGVHSL